MDRLSNPLKKLYTLNQEVTKVYQSILRKFSHDQYDSKMIALGELLIFIIYLFFGILLLVSIYNEFKIKGKLRTESIKRILLAALPLIIWSSYRYYLYRADQLEYVGKYYLTEYPNCDSCILELKNDSFYEVVANGKSIEEGEWSYESGGDYWIVEIGEHGQLGSGKFKYSDKVNE